MMGKLAEVLERTTSRDVICTGFEVYDGRKATEELENKKSKYSGPVKETLDLSLFECFNASTCSSFQGRTGAWFTVNKRGEIRLSHEIGKDYEVGATVEFYLNKPGTILVMREAKNGFPLKAADSKSLSKRLTCRELGSALEKKGVELPVRFVAAWDEGLKAWVGRR